MSDFFQKPFVRRLLDGPDDVELSDKDLALLKAYLNTGYPVQTVQRERRQLGYSPTGEKWKKLNLIYNYNCNLRAIRAEALAAKAKRSTQQGDAQTHAETPGANAKRSTVPGDAPTKLIAALTKHHEYADGSCLNQEPITLRTLAKAAGVSPSTASEFFSSAFGSYEAYRAACRDESKLIASLKLLNDDFRPLHLLGDLADKLPAKDTDDE